MGWARRAQQAARSAPRRRAPADRRRAASFGSFRGARARPAAAGPHAAARRRSGRQDAARAGSRVSQPARLSPADRERPLGALDGRAGAVRAALDRRPLRVGRRRIRRARGRHRPDRGERRRRAWARTHQGQGRRRDRAGPGHVDAAHDAGCSDRSDGRRRSAAARGDRGVPLWTLREGRGVSGAQPSILLVDDRRENLLALEAILAPLGHRLVSVTSGAEALKEILLGEFACILLDVQMPELDGFELAALIKQRRRSQHIPIIFVTALSTDGPDGGATYFNRRWFEYTGMSPDDAGPNAWQQFVHPDDLALALARREETVHSGETFEVEYRFRALDGTYRWHLVRAVPVRGESGGIELWIGTATDIDDRKRIEDQRSFIVAAGDALSRSLDYRETLTQVAVLAAGDVADWCAVHVVEADGSISEVAVAHTDPAKITFARELEERYPPDPKQRTGPAAVIRSGKPEVVGEITDELLEQTAVDELQLDLMRQLDLCSYMCVPLKSRERVLGAITFVSSESGRRFGDDDLQLAEELARRATTAIENARLYREAEDRAQAARVLATIGDGVFLVDRSGRIRLWNGAAERITRVAETEVVGHPAAEAIPGWAGIEPGIPVAHAGQPVQAKSVPVELGGRELWLSFSAVGYEDGTVYAFRDLTEERALESMRQDIVATVSHELRTPLAAIYGAALTLRRGDIELEHELRDKLLEIVAEESGRLSEIVNDLLLASQLDSGKLRANIERCDP